MYDLSDVLVLGRPLTFRRLRQEPRVIRGVCEFRCRIQDVLEGVVLHLLHLESVCCSFLLFALSIEEVSDEVQRTKYDEDATHDTAEDPKRYLSLTIKKGWHARAIVEAAARVGTLLIKLADGVQWTIVCVVANGLVQRVGETGVLTTALGYWIGTVVVACAG